MLAPTRKLSPLTVLERESCSYWRGRPVSVVRSSEPEFEDGGTRVEAMDRLSSSRDWEVIVVVGAGV